MAGKLATYSYMNSATSILGSDQISIPSGQGNKVFTIGVSGRIQGTNRSRFANLPITWVGGASNADTVITNYIVDHSRRSFRQGKLQGPGSYLSSPNRGIRQNELSVTENATYKVQLASTGTPGPQYDVAVIPFVTLSELNKLVAALNDPQSGGWGNIGMPSLPHNNDTIYDIGYGCPIYQVRGIHSWDPIISSVGLDPIYWKDAYIGYFAPMTSTSGDYLYFNVSLPQRQSKSMTSIDSVAQFSAAGGGSWGYYI